MKKTLTLLALAIAGIQTVTAQSANSNRCGLDIVRESYFAAHPEARATYATSRAATLSSATDVQAKTTANGPIPVIFHIVLTAGQLSTIGGIAGVAERVDSSIAVLNRDFNRRNPDSTQIPAVFKSRYANVDIQFGLARRDELGQASPGYEIYTIPSSTGITAFSVNPVSSAAGSGFACSDAKYNTAQGGNGLSAWDVSKYLNIWVCNMNNPNGVLGIALSPGTTSSFGIPAVERGLVLNYGAFGKRRLPTQYFITGIDGSRTLTHEAGHFFELDHIWGGSDPENCSDDDGIGDTPQQLDENFGCPNAVIANCTNSAGGEMWMNYMDYCDDICLVMFSTQQGNLMRAQVQGSGPSVTLTQNPILVTPLAINNVQAQVNLTLSPNPARGYATLSYNTSQKLKSAILMDATGRAVRTFAIASTAGTLSLDLQGIAAGLYTLRADFEAGGATQKLVVQP